MSTNVKITEPRNGMKLSEARAVHAGWERQRSEIDGTQHRQGGVHVEQGDLLPMEEGYPEQCWKVVGFAPNGVIAVGDFYDDDHIIDYDSYEIEQRNYTVIPYDKVEELKE